MNKTNQPTSKTNQEKKQLIIDFKDFLASKKLTKTSIKNYLSDIRQFLKWTANSDFSSFTPAVFSTYKSSLVSSSISTKTINRSLTSLRKFGQFLKQEKLLMANPADKLNNIQAGQRKKILFSLKLSSKILKNFSQALNQENLKPATVKNYVLDVNQFLQWLKKRS